ncbi:helix-turn-helix transcriptional regulator [Spirosoma flavum]|uniref:Helix-turn-helix transcriptional regulator n=1 Tax=Spirosoma flavum TaxID=2048557 RepID=A0ABW6APT6_9BACT
MPDQQALHQLASVAMDYVSESFEPVPLVTSAPLSWQGVRVEQYHLGAGELPAHYQAHHLLMLYQVEIPLVMQHRHGTRVSKNVFRTGDLGLYPGGEYDLSLTWNTPSDNIYLTVDNQYMAQIADQVLNRTPFTLSRRPQFHDPFLVQLGRQLLAAAGSRHALGLLYIESLTNALCHHLIEYQATERVSRRAQRLTGPVLARIDAYLEAYVEAPVTLETLAGLAHLSVFHFARLFKQTTGLSPYQYVLRWKIQRAQYLLRLGGAPVADIGDALGFGSLASFSTAFKRAVGRSPQQFQRNPAG